MHDPRCAQNGHGCHPGCISNVERFCGALLERRQLRVGDGEYEDTLAYLIAEAWIHAGNYDHHKDGGSVPTWRPGSQSHLPAPSQTENGRLTAPSGNGKAVATKGRSRSSSTSTSPDWRQLSDEGVWRLKNLAVRIWAGYSETEVAETHGETPAWVRTELGTLRDELRRVGQ